MPFDITGIGENAANSAIGAIMGIALEKHNDKRQIRQQQKLQNMQMQGNKDMMDYSFAKELQMWKDTNFHAQMEQLKKAGLNPGLIYGMGGAGGATTGSPGGSGVSGADAPKGGGEALGMGISMMQNQAIAAQIELTKAQTEKTKAEATKTATVDTAKTTVEIESLSQGVENQKSANTLMKIEAELKRVDLGFNRATYDDRIEYIHQEAREMEGRASQALIQANVDEQTIQTKINTIRAEYVQRLLENALITAKTKSEYQQIKESQSNILVNEQQIKAMANDIMIKWDTLGNEMDRTRYLKDKVQFETEPGNKVLEGLTTGIGLILGARAVQGTKGTTPVRGFHTRQ